MVQYQLVESQLEIIDGKFKDYDEVKPVWRQVIDTEQTEWALSTSFLKSVELNPGNFTSLYTGLGSLDEERVAAAEKETAVYIATGLNWSVPADQLELSKNSGQDIQLQTIKDVQKTIEQSVEEAILQGKVTVDGKTLVGMYNQANVVTTLLTKGDAALDLYKLVAELVAGQEVYGFHPDTLLYDENYVAGWLTSPLSTQEQSAKKLIEDNLGITNFLVTKNLPADASKGAVMTLDRSPGNFIVKQITSGIDSYPFWAGGIAKGSKSYEGFAYIVFTLEVANDRAIGESHAITTA